jgi:hypothetical protein
MATKLKSESKCGPKKFNFLNIWPFGIREIVFLKNPTLDQKPALIFRTRIETRIGIYFYFWEEPYSKPNSWFYLCVKP